MYLVLYDSGQRSSRPTAPLSEKTQKAQSALEPWAQVRSDRCVLFGNTAAGLPFTSHTCYMHMCVSKRTEKRGTCRRTNESRPTTNERTRDVTRSVAKCEEVHNVTGHVPRHFSAEDANPRFWRCGYVSRSYGCNSFLGTHFRAPCAATGELKPERGGDRICIPFECNNRFVFLTYTICTQALYTGDGSSHIGAGYTFV